MNDVVVVGILNRAGDVPHDEGGLGRPHRLIGDQCRQRRTFDVGHREVVMPGLFADLEDRNDVGMVEFGGGFGLGLKWPARPPD